MKPIIPESALDDRLGWVGTSGSGKTYNAGASAETLLDSGARAVIVDPLDVWWGLRLMADGKSPSPYRVVIFGGAHADLPVTENAGALIGETVAGMAESCIVSLGSLGTKAAERRFMTAFLDTLYRRASGEPVHVIFDEADLWAPQKAIEPMLQNLMEQIVRRGRVRGFIPWLITQRPAVISKDVLSQVDGLIAFKLTSSQDRDALEGWIEGQADRQEWKAIRAQLPTLERGAGVIWIPGRGILETKSFPHKRTFDSSRTPKRGEKKLKAAELEPLDLAALKERLAKVEAETKENDPKALRAKIAKLEAIANKHLAENPLVVDHKATEEAERRGYERGKLEAARILREIASEAKSKIHVALGQLSIAAGHVDGLAELAERAPVPQVYAKRHTVPAPSPAPRQAAATAAGVTGPQQRILDALAWLEAVGVADAHRKQLALLAKASPTSSSYTNNLGALRSAGLLDYSEGSRVFLTPDGRAAARVPVAPPTTADLHTTLRAELSEPQWRILEQLIRMYPESLDKSTLADMAGASVSSSSYTNNLGALRSLGLIDYPSRGDVVALPVLFLGR